MKWFAKRGQSIAEYSILIALIIAAAIGIQTYVKRGIQGRMKDGSDTFVHDLAANYQQYDTGLGATAATATTIPLCQFEPEEFARKSTLDTRQDYEQYKLSDAGTTERNIIQTTAQNKDDYQSYTYNGPK